MQQLPHQPKTLITEHQSANFSEVLVNEEIAAHQQALKQDVENFYLQVIDNSESVSALAYLKTQNLPWDGEIWLYQILADYQSLPKDEQKMFSLRNEETPASASNQLMLISDIHIQLRVS